MRKFRSLITLVAVAMAAIASIAFSRTTPKQSLYYYNSDEACVVAPCEAQDNTGKACLLTVYTDSTCQNLYTGSTWNRESE